MNFLDEVLNRGGQISIPFTRDEWEDISIAIGCFYEGEDALGAGKPWEHLRNIQDRIEKTLGVE